jgi:hypothetical protein
MNGIESGGRGPEVEDAGPKVLDENKTAEVAVTRDEDAILIASYDQQLAIFGSCATDLGCGNYIMALSPQEPRGQGIDVLIEEKPHAEART